MKLFTWNLGGREAMVDKAIRYLEELATTDHVIAVFQEWPSGVTAVSSSLQVSESHNRIKMLHSQGISVMAALPDSSERALVCKYEISKTGTQFVIVGLHWHHRDGLRSELNDCYERGGAAALFREDLEALLIRLGSKPFVVMGDFNIDPGKHGREFASKYCFFSPYSAVPLGPAMSKIGGRNRTRWFPLTPKNKSESLGTYYWRKAPDWLLIDHIVLSAELHKNAGASVEILREFPAATTAGITQKSSKKPKPHSLLTTTTQIPRGKNHGSDHLPVICSLHLQ